MDSLNRTLARFGSYHPYDLVKLTHTPGSPWDYAQKHNTVITNEPITTYHSVELNHLKSDEK